MTISTEEVSAKSGVIYDRLPNNTAYDQGEIAHMARTLAKERDELQSRVTHLEALLKANSACE